MYKKLLETWYGMDKIWNKHKFKEQKSNIHVANLHTIFTVVKKNSDKYFSTNTLRKNYRERYL